MQEEITQLKNRITELENQIKNFNDYSTITYEVEKALIARGFTSSTDRSSVSNALAKAGGVDRTFFVATVSGGAVATEITITDGLVITQ